MKPFYIALACFLSLVGLAIIAPAQNPAPSPGYNLNSPLHIVATNPNGPDGTPNEQIFIENPATSGTSAQAMLGFGVYNGSTVAKCGWVGVTSNSFTFAPYAQATYLENNCAGGVRILSDDPTNGLIAFYTGGYSSDSYKRLLITAAGQVVTEGIDGSTQGLAVQSIGLNPTQAKSYMPINFYDGSTLDSQIIQTNSNYNNAGVNIAPSSLGILNEATSGYVYIAAAGGSGYVVFNVGGYDAAHTRVVMAPDGGLQIVTASQPTCNAAHRGTIFYIAGGSGVADVREMCMKDASNTYAWSTF